MKNFTIIVVESVSLAGCVQLRMLHVDTQHRKLTCPKYYRMETRVMLWATLKARFAKCRATL